MQRYFVGKDKNGNFLFTEQDLFHIGKVMRCKVGDKIEVVFNKEVCIVQIDSFNPFSVSLVSKLEKNSEVENHMTLLLPLLKSDKAELIMQKATELGVHSIIFYLSKRSIIKLDQKDFDKKQRIINIETMKNEEKYVLKINKLQSELDIVYTMQDLYEEKEKESINLKKLVLNMAKALNYSHSIIYHFQHELKARPSVL